MAPDLKTQPRTDGQGGINVYVVVDQPSSVKARQFKFSLKDIFKVFFLFFFLIHFRIVTILDLGRVTRKTGCLSQFGSKNNCLFTFRRGFDENNVALTPKLCTRKDSMRLFV